MSGLARFDHLSNQQPIEVELSTGDVLLARIIGKTKEGTVLISCGTNNHDHFLYLENNIKMLVTTDTTC